MKECSKSSYKLTVCITFTNSTLYCVCHKFLLLVSLTYCKSSTLTDLIGAVVLFPKTPWGCTHASTSEHQIKLLHVFCSSQLNTPRLASTMFRCPLQDNRYTLDKTQKCFFHLRSKGKKV